MKAEVVNKIIKVSKVLKPSMYIHKLHMYMEIH